VTDGVVRLAGELERKSMLAATLRAVRAVDGVIDVEAQHGYAIDDIRLPHGSDHLETVSSPVARRRVN